MWYCPNLVFVLLFLCDDDKFSKLVEVKKKNLIWTMFIYDVMYYSTLSKKKKKEEEEEEEDFMCYSTFIFKWFCL